MQSSSNFFIRIFRSRWFRSFLLAVVLAVLVWFCGPLIGIGSAHPLDTEFVRYAVIAGIFIFWLVWNLVQMIRDNRREKRLAEAVVSDVDAAAKEKEKASSEEVALLTDRLKEAMTTLKKSKIGGSKKKLSLLPWYMFIGPPGAGKTTALVNCGLKFPLAEKEGAHALRGVGGTRNCEWWFADEAVLIDTAGRYTTQDSQAEVDSAGWLGFLHLLKKHRKRQPINGIIVAISLFDLATLSEEERIAHAKACRRRLRELNEHLGVRPPVYVLFTKADLIAGFVEFFDNMGKEEREQVWGATLPLDNGKDPDGAVAGFGPEFDLLLERLNDRMLERVHQEPDIRRRRLIYGFPQQVASLKDVANDFLQEVFRPSRLEPRSLLRGVYLTSGTQDGTPIDRLLGAMTAEFGLPRQAVSAYSGSGRSYFLTRLVREVIFGEAALVSTDPKVERRIRWTHRGAYAIAVLVLLLLGGAWTNSYLGNRQLIAEVHAATTRYAQQYETLAQRGPSDTDLPAVVPPLDTLRSIRGGYGERDLATPIALTFGLYQGAKLGIASTGAYTHALNRLLLPRLLSRVEKRMSESMGNPDFLYETLKVYLMLGGKHSPDKELITQWVSADLLAAYPSAEESVLRESIGVHVQGLLDNPPFESIPLNDALIAQARAVLTKEPLSLYSYHRLMRSRPVLAIPVWSLAENGGPAAGQVFAYRSGRSLDDGVAGIYTWSGYRVFQRLLFEVSKDISEDSWVLGREQLTDPANLLRNTTRLRQDVLKIYLDDYVREWDKMLADIIIKPFNTVDEGRVELSYLVGPSSPLRELMLGIDHETQLTRQGATDQLSQAAQQRAARVAQRAGRFAAFEARTGLSFQQNQLLSVISEAFGTDPSGKPIDPAKFVDEHFKRLHDWINGGPATGSNDPPMEAAIQRINGVYQTMLQVSSATNQGQAMIDIAGGPSGTASTSANPVQQLQEMARNPATPPVAAPLLQAVAASAAQVTSAGASRELSDAWKSKVLPLCEAINRYPLIKTSTTDAQIDDFVALLGPDGQIKKFFDQYLQRFVDTTQRPWRWQAQGAPLGLSPSSLTQFDLAAQIRDALFPNGGNTFQVKFQLASVNLDPSVGQISIDVGGTTLTDNHGPVDPVQFQWPGANGRTQVRVTMTPASGANADVQTFDGPWALLRMLDAAKITPTNQPDKFRIQFRGGGGTATFDLTASSVRNPFNLDALRSFRCPARL
jgi:type VI secretion system protein ImpL